MQVHDAGRAAPERDRDSSRLQQNNPGLEHTNPTCTSSSARSHLSANFRKNMKVHATRVLATTTVVSAVFFNATFSSAILSAPVYFSINAVLLFLPIV